MLEAFWAEFWKKWRNNASKGDAKRTCRILSRRIVLQGEEKRCKLQMKRAQEEVCLLLQCAGAFVS